MDHKKIISEYMRSLAKKSVAKRKASPEYKEQMKAMVQKRWDGYRERKKLSENDFHQKEKVKKP